MHYFPANDDEKGSYVNTIRPVAKRYLDHIHFTITDDEEFPDILSAAGSTRKLHGQLVLEDTTTGKLIPYEGAMNSKELAHQAEWLVENFLANSATSNRSTLARGGQKVDGNHDEL